MRYIPTLLFLYLLAQTSFSSNATKVLGCPFSLQLNLLPGYSFASAINASYTINALKGCAVPQLSGNLSIYNKSSGELVYLQNLNTNSISNSKTYYINITTANLTNSTYVAALFLAKANLSNSSYAQFKMFGNSSIVVSSISSSSTLSESSPMPLFINITNIGELASGNITINILGKGANNFSDHVSAPALSWQQSELVGVYLNNATTNPGSSSLGINVSYGSGKKIIYSRKKTFNYAVNMTKAGSVAIPATPIVSKPAINITDAPLLTSMAAGQTKLVQLGFLNSGSAAEYINMSVNKNFTQFLSISTNSVYLLPGQRISVAILFKAPPKTQSGTYYVPINLTGSIVKGSKTSQMEYLPLVLYNLSAYPSISPQITLSNGTRALSGILQISPGLNSSISNATTLTTKLPISIASNISQISAYGLINNLTRQNSSYSIDWNVPFIGADQVTYAYFNINKLASQAAALNLQNIIREAFAPKQNIVRILNASSPALLNDSQYQITLYGLYAGAQAQKVSFLVSNPEIKIYNASQTQLFLPNTFFKKSFGILTSSKTGTQVISFLITTNTSTLVYNMPVIVRQKPGTAAQNPPAPKSANGYDAAILIIVITFLTVIFLNALRENENRAKYNPERVRTMIRLRQQIERGTEGDE